MFSETTLRLETEQKTITRTIRVSEGSGLSVVVHDASSTGTEASFAAQVYPSPEEAEAAVGHIISISILQGYVIHGIG